MTSRGNICIEQTTLNSENQENHKVYILMHLITAQVWEMADRKVAFIWHLLFKMISLSHLRKGKFIYVIIYFLKIVLIFLILLVGLFILDFSCSAVNPAF